MVGGCLDGAGRARVAAERITGSRTAGGPGVHEILRRRIRRILFAPPLPANATANGYPGRCGWGFSCGAARLLFPAPLGCPRAHYASLSSMPDNRLGSTHSRNHTYSHQAHTSKLKARNHTYICHLRRVKCGEMDTNMSLTTPEADGQSTLTNHRRTHTSLFATTGAGRGDWSYPVAPASTGLLTRKTAKSSGVIRGDGRPPSQFPSLNIRHQIHVVAPLSISAAIFIYGR